MSRLSVVLPAYNEELMTAKVCRTLKEILDHEGISYELVLVDDGSSDGTWNQIEQISEQDPFPGILEKKLQLWPVLLRRAVMQWL